jgi:polynucleotide 5'-hydroxyl-kinase GRC3/NOL9
VHRDARRTILVIGARDTGKSTFCRFLVDAAITAGQSAALLDTDLGQKILGPPACVTMSDPRGLSLAFVGTTNPVLGWRRLIEGTRHLAERTDADRRVVNTSGLLAGPGRRLKAAKIDALRPDLLIALGEEPSLEAIAEARPELPILRLPSSPQARRKTDGERRALRREAFRHYFATGASLNLPRRLLRATEVDAPLPSGLLLGLSDERGNDLGLGLLIEDSNGGAMLKILSPVARGGIAQVSPGFLRLDGNFSETSVPAAPQAS